MNLLLSALACGASREEVRAVAGFAPPPSATHLYVRDVSIGLRDGRTEASFRIPFADRAQLDPLLPCAPEDCGPNWRCFEEGDHDALDVVLTVHGDTLDVVVGVSEYDNLLPQVRGGCRR